MLYLTEYYSSVAHKYLSYALFFFSHFSFRLLFGDENLSGCGFRTYFLDMAISLCPTVILRRQM